MPRLLLVEFAVIDRFHRAREFPVVQGLARRDGLKSLWVRFAVAAGSRRLGAAAGAALPPEDEARLRRLAGAFQPSHVILSAPPEPSLARALRSAAAGVRLGCLGEERPRPSSRAVGLDLAGVPAFLGLPRRRAEWTSAADAALDFGWIAGNEAARTLEPLPFVGAGHECRYDKAFARNAFFRGVDLSRSLRPGGCSFCVRRENRGRAPGFSARGLARQLSAIEKTCPRPDGQPLWVRLGGEVFVSEIEAVVRVLRRAGMRPVELLLDSRADALLRSAAGLERALRRLAGTGHRVSLALVGIENFSGAELERYNKGLTPGQNLEAVRRLFDWETRYPRCFGFRKHGGLSMITFNPWTQPQEADLNFAVAELAGIAGAMGKLFTGRLRLYPGLPLEAKARRDGLLRARCADPMLETARRNFYGTEIPWRFQAPEMESVDRIVTRFSLETPRREDALARDVGALLRDGARRGLPPQRLAHFAILAALQDAWAGRRSGPAALLRAVRRWVTRFALDNNEAVAWADPDSLRPDGVALRLASKPVLKIEPIRGRDLPAWRALGFLPNATFRRRAGSASEPVWELFCGRDAAEVGRAVALSEREASLSAGAVRRATRGVGRSLGYPECCARAYAAEAWGTRGSNFWSHVANRVAAAGAVPWELNPFSDLVAHVPCSLRCGPSLRQARRGLAASRDSGLERRLKNPWLSVWGSERTCVELVPEDRPSGRFRYRAGCVIGDSPELRAIQDGDELRLDEETTLILREGRPYASLSGRAFVWWYRRAFQVDFWRAMAALRRAVPERLQGAAEASSPEASDGRRRAVPREAIRRLLGEVDAESRRCGIPSRSGYDGELIRVSWQDQAYGLLLVPRGRQQGPCFASLPSFQVCIRGEVRMTGAEQDRLRAYLGLLARRDDQLRRILGA